MQIAHAVIGQWACHSLGSQQILVFEGGALKIDDPLWPERNLQNPPHLGVHLTWTQDDHVIILNMHKHNMWSN